MILYIISNKISSKRYIGQTVSSLKSRWYQHKSDNSHCRYLRRAIQKYGAENFEIKILSHCTSKKEMNHRETYYINLFNTLAPNGYNLNTGGNSKIASEATRAKMSASQKGKKKPFSQKHKEALRQAQLGKKQSDSLIEKRASKHRHPVLVIETGHVFNSIKEAAAQLGTHTHVIRAVLNGKRSDYKGMTLTRSP